MAEAGGDPGCGLTEAPQPRQEKSPLLNNRTASTKQTRAELAGRLLAVLRLWEKELQPGRRC